MKKNNSWIVVLIGIALSACGKQKEIKENTSNEDISEIIISLEKTALAATDGMAFVELSDTDVVYFDPSLERKIEGLQQLRTHYENMGNMAPADSFNMIRPIVQITQNMAVLTFNLDSYEAGNVIKWNCTEVYRRNPNNQWKIIQTHWSLVQPVE